MESKFCKFCGVDHPLTKEYWNIGDGRFKHCKKQRKQYKTDNKDVLKISDKKYRIEHKEEIKVRDKNYNDNNKDKRIKRDLKNRDHIKKWSRKYLEENRETINKQRIKTRSKNPEKYRSNANGLQKIRRKNDIDFRIACNLRSRINKAIKRNQKSGSAVRDMGCTGEELRKYLESKFYPNPRTGENMTWDNYGRKGWEIDHIIPLAVFDKTNRDQFLVACHYTNLQPLWWFENLEKRDKLL